MKRFGVAVGLMMLGVPALAFAQAGSLLVLSKRDHTLSMVDGASLKTTGKAAVGNDPHEVVVSEDGTRAYVSNYGFGAFHTLGVVELAGMKALPAIDLGPLAGPHGLAVAGGKTWFTSEVAKAVGRYDPVSGKVDLVVGTGQNRIHMLHVSADAQQIVATNVNSGTVSLLDWVPVKMAPPPGSNAPQMEWNQTVVKVGNGSEGFDLSPDGREIWVANAKDATVSVIDRASKSVVATADVGGHGANRLKFTPDGKLVLLSSGPELVVMDVATRKVIKHVPVGTGSAGILIEPGGARAFVACMSDNYVAVIDLKTLTVVGRIEAGAEPDGMAWVVRR